MEVLSWGSHLQYFRRGLAYLHVASFISLGRFCGWSVCDLGGSSYCLWGLERKSV